MNLIPEKRKMRQIPRLPLEGSIDLTYRCNNNCLHCWISVPQNGEVKQNELTFAEIRRIVDEARALGCRRWNISGGEPMLRPDFPEIFDYLTSKATGYTLNTNGTLITPEIAWLLKRKGTKMIALYGATAEVYDHITRNPGGFSKLMQGFSYLMEAGAAFIVQLIPMRANWHQFDKMIALAKNFSSNWRIGAPWIYLSSDRSPARHKQIAAQRLQPECVIELDKPNPAYSERWAETGAPTAKNPLVHARTGDSFSAPPAPPAPPAAQLSCSTADPGDDRLFAGCIAARRDFHIDAYGQISWCSFIKDPQLRFNLRTGSFEEAWEKFIPSCADKVRGGEEWRRHCGSCAKRSDCRWCAVYAYLETGRYSAPVPYLCRVADEAVKFKQKWQEKHRRYFKVAGITVRLESDIDFDHIKFRNEMLPFAVKGPGEDNVTIRHHFELPDLTGKDLGKEIYRKTPWVVSRKNGTWFYRGTSPAGGDENLHKVAVFTADHRHATIYSPPYILEKIQEQGWYTLSLFPDDEIWLSPLLARRNAVLLHAAVAVVNGKGFVFAGHSGKGKSTTMELLKNACTENGLRTEILCDERSVIRKWPQGWRVHGIWKYSTIVEVSPSNASILGIFFPEQARENKIIPVTDKKLIWRHLLSTMIRIPFDAGWWQRELGVLEQLIADVPCYTMRFDKSGAIVPELEKLTW